jgi:hypothetical protein
MVRPPQPPVYFFVIDVSENSVSSGFLFIFLFIFFLIFLFLFFF